MKAVEAHSGEAPRPTTFERIVCDIAASRLDPVAVRQAAILAGSGHSIDVVCVTFAVGQGRTAQATISRSRAERALRRAHQTARQLGVEARTRIVSDPDSWAAVAREASGHDLLVVGTHNPSRAEGIVLGWTATQAVHRAEVPVLVARPELGDPFPESLLVALDGSASSEAALELAVAIVRVHHSRAILMTVDREGSSAGRTALAAASAKLFEAAGVEPVLLTPSGSARDETIAAAHEHRSSLVVIGSGGKTGLRAIGSVSEHVAHHAPCSVLVARPSRGRPEP